MHSSKACSRSVTRRVTNPRGRARHSEESEETVKRRNKKNMRKISRVSRSRRNDSVWIHGENSRRFFFFYKAAYAKRKKTFFRDDIRREWRTHFFSDTKTTQYRATREMTTHFAITTFLTLLVRFADIIKILRDIIFFF